MPDSATTPPNLTFDRLLDTLAEKIAIKLCEDPSRLYPRLLTVEQAAVYVGLTKDALQLLISADTQANVEFSGGASTTQQRLRVFERQQGFPQEPVSASAVPKRSRPDWAISSAFTSRQRFRIPCAIRAAPRMIAVTTCSTPAPGAPFPHSTQNSAFQTSTRALEPRPHSSPRTLEIRSPGKPRHSCVAATRRQSRCSAWL